MIEILLFFGPLLCCSLDFSEAAAEAQANLLCCCSSLLTKLYWSRENSVDDVRRRILGRRLGAFLTRHFTFFFRQMTIILFRFSTFLLLEIFCHSFSWFFFLQWVLFRLKSLKSIDCSNFGRETLSRRAVQTEAIKTSLTVLPDFKMLIFGSHWKEEETKKREWYPTIVVLVEFFFFKLCDLVQLCSSLLWKLRVFFFWHSQ